MSLFSRRIPYDRKKLIDRAAALERGWRWRKALAIYRQVLAAEPHSAELHARVAPLLARTGRRIEAWESFKIAIDARLRGGDDASARTLQQQAVRLLPDCPEPVRALAKAELARQRGHEAIRLLVDGSRRMSRLRSRGAAILLLRDARTIEPWNAGVVLSLCRQLARDGQPAEALFLLDHLEQRSQGDQLRAVRALQWRIEPSLRHSWRWLGAVREQRRQGSPGVGGAAASRT